MPVARATLLGFATPIYPICPCTTLRTVTRARKRTGQTASKWLLACVEMVKHSSKGKGLDSIVEPARVHALNAHKIPAILRKNGTGNTLSDPFVLYWMQNSVRSRHSPALEYAAETASRLEIPLKVVHLFDVVAQDDRPLPERHAYFLLEALAVTQSILRECRNISLAVVAPGTPSEEAIPALAENAVGVITDTSYLRHGIQDRLRVAEKLKAKGIPLIAIEGDVVVPVEEVTDKAEHAARTIRPKISRLINDYLNPLEPVQLSSKIQPRLDCNSRSSTGTRAWLEKAGLGTLDIRNVPAAVAKLPGLDRGSPRVPGNLFPGGETRAQQLLHEFLEKKLAQYASGRNEPALNLQSDLSPYLRIGAISPVDVVLQTKAHEKQSKSKGVKEGAESFLEELVIRRELGVNMCWFARNDYDVYDKTVPDFAKKTLELHKSDQRPKLYSYEDLEAAVTGDEFWNAAQLELLVTGKMHGYMRMYWAKLIIQWVSDPETALDYCVRLNNRWELDAVDPNSYAGVIWNFGRHDQGWKERPIYGKVRYMNDSGLKRKFNMAAYTAKIDQLVRKYGLPQHIEKVRSKSKKRKSTQMTIGESMSGSNSHEGREGKSSKKSPAKTRPA